MHNTPLPPLQAAASVAILSAGTWALVVIVAWSLLAAVGLVSWW